VLATTLAIVAVFAPVAFMGGIIGLFFFQFGLTVVVAVMISLFVSFTLDPMLSSVWADPAGNRFKRIPWLGRFLTWFDGRIEALQHRYERVIRWALGHRKTVLFGAIGLFVASMFLFPLIGSEFVPKEDQSEFGMRLETPVGSSLDYTTVKVAQAEAELKKIPEIKLLYSGAGGGRGKNTGWINVILKPRNERVRSQKEIEDVARDAVKGIAGMTVSVGWNKPVQVSFVGPDATVLKQLSEQFVERLEKINGVVDIDSSEKAAVPALVILPKRAEAAEFGITPATIGTVSRALVAGDAVVTWLPPSGNSVDVSVRLPAGVRNDTAQLLQIPLANPRAPDGDALALERVATLAESTNPKSIERAYLQRQVTISANAKGRPPGDVGGDVNKLIEAFPLPPGYRFQQDGDNQVMRDSFGYAIVALVLAVTFIYFVLGSQFMSFAQPLAIMATLPMSLIGVMLALLLTRTTFNMFAMIAFIMLMIWISGRICMSVPLLDQCADFFHEQVTNADQPRHQHILMGLAIAYRAVAGGHGHHRQTVAVEHLVPEQGLRIQLEAAGLFILIEELLFRHQAAHQEGLAVFGHAAEGAAGGPGQILVPVANVTDLPVEDGRDVRLVARADHQGAPIEQGLLAFDVDLGQQDVAAVAQQLVVVHRPITCIRAVRAGCRRDRHARGGPRPGCRPRWTA